jgi:hypothetical protein
VAVVVPVTAPLPVSSAIAPATAPPAAHALAITHRRFRMATTTASTPALLLAPRITYAVIPLLLLRTFPLGWQVMGVDHAIASSDPGDIDPDPASAASTKYSANNRSPRKQIPKPVSIPPKI